MIRYIITKKVKNYKSRFIFISDLKGKADNDITLTHKQIPRKKLQQASQHTKVNSYRRGISHISSDGMNGCQTPMIAIGEPW